MKIKSTTHKSTILQEGVYSASVSTVTAKPNEEKPEQVIVEFDLGQHGKVNKTYPASIDPETLLRRDAQTLLGRTLNEAESAEFDPAQLVGKNCRVTVMHQSIAGGRVVAKAAIVTSADPAKD